MKGRKYIGTPVKYYYSDLGLRNARLEFRQLEETHIMENILYNDLIRRGMIVVVKDYMKPWQDDNGIMYIGIEQFLLDEDILR